MRVLVTGATGFIGKVIVRQLQDNGDQVVVLTRNVAKAALTLGSQCRYFQWPDTNTVPPLEAFEGVDGVINLLGENIGDRPWDEERKKKIYNSRVDGTARLVEAISKLSARPKVFVSTSAIGIYGDRGDEEIIESSSTGDGFLAHVCKSWESKAKEVEKTGARLVIIRAGMVLGRKGGALVKMLPIFRKGLGGKVGSGKQYVSWIHIEDLAAMYLEALRNESVRGVYNGTAPYPATNKEFTKTLGKVLRRPTLFPAPGFVIKAAFGEMSTLLLEGQKVLPSRFKEEKIRYRYPTLDMALKETAF